MPSVIPMPGPFAAGLILFLVVIWDAFEAIILPRRVTRRFRLTRAFYRILWTLWKGAAAVIPSRRTREALLGFFGPISLLILVGVWAIGLVLSFGLMQYGAGSAVNVTGIAPGFWTDAYLSGTTFFTLGIGDVVPRSGLARFLVVAESGFRIGLRPGVPGCCYRVLAFHLWFLFQARSEHLASGQQRRQPAIRGRAASPPQRYARPASAP